MKKCKNLIVILTGLLLLSSCSPKENVGPIELPESRFSPTPIVVPTCTPTEGPVPTMIPSPTVTSVSTPVPVAETPTPTVETDEPVLKPTEEPVPEPSITPTVAPVIEATPTESGESMPTLSPTSAPEPTETPLPTVAELSPTSTPVPTETPVPTVAPVPTVTPTVNPEWLVMNGWQKTLSFDEKYTIIFPEIFRDSSLSRTDNKLELGYSSPEEETVEFIISYRMNQTLEAAVDEILTAGGIIEEKIPEENRVSYLLYVDGRMHRGVLVEEQYATALLGTTFGEEEFVVGVMNVVFCHQEDFSGTTWSEEYEYYVIRNREEE